ncbi:thiamine pyrophosphokinase [Aspergillus nomiae NRRL 13137]|uniref:Thiamine pyrophosphokinase n=1 Tax=Aspergillus nomiae NRRL (strain ATCC 15546 / NRRL 13137 / CBS 260.88 / M93) TaxID=1509407 RepID=A0A0L1J1W9_ASPN3|nr:thiamine pyrophosphokinase [Aspergillus nomiae NRRL 13137]KNG85408.1 thiamine pyrophosphokinase [Aspergillus nomiae NRRL 13137]
MEWDPTQFFRDDHTPNPFALLILNQPINERAFRVLKRHAKITLCADGGANRFYSMMKAHDRESTDLPDLIIGDLDSITPDTRTHYANLGVRIIEDEDQYSTDFTKCLDYLRTHVGEFISSSSPVSKPEEQNEEGGRGSELDVLILGGLGGRVDQAFSQIHHLYSMTQTYSSSSTSNQEGTGKIGNLYLISEESITFILRPGVNTIRTPGTNRPGISPAEQGEDLLEENVGIIPLSGPARITTSGFQWDVVDWRTAIGGQLSTSNHIRSEVVTVESLVPVLFTVELAERLKRTR